MPSFMRLQQRWQLCRQAGRHEKEEKLAHSNVSEHRASKEGEGGRDRERENEGKKNRERSVSIDVHVSF